jgi:outer membrane immunogenic protein
MQKSHLIFLASVSAGAILSMGAASAADLPAQTYTKAPVLAAAVYNWTGFYIGVNAGGASGRIRDTLSIDDTEGFFFPPAVPGVAASGSSKLNKSSFTGGVQAGYNWQSDRFVFGLEADFNSFRQSSSYGGTFLYTTNLAPYTLTVSRSTNWLMTFRPRVGIVTGNALLYVTGGLALTDFKFNQNFADVDVESATISKVKAGWTVGAGAEAQLGGNWSVKAEYLFARFDVGSATGLLPGAVLTNSLTSLDEHIGRVGLNYRFGGPVVGRY